LASAIIGSECNFLPTLFFAFRSQALLQLKPMILLPPKCGFRLVLLNEIYDNAASKPADKR